MLYVSVHSSLPDPIQVEKMDHQFLLYLATINLEIGYEDIGTGIVVREVSCIVEDM